MESETDIRIKELHEKARSLIKQDMEEDALVEEMKKEGIEAGYARLIIDNVKSDIRDRADAWKLIFMDVFFIVGGLYINYFSYRIAENAKASYFYLFWGIVVVGILMLVRAFFLFRK